ncbi:MAG: hypothetical protein NTU57_00625 [Candidatus Aenigmarchaeota archaeon]|nr:hypothetical protein [Candidatus Aenigmarchaeota archaeon]
MTFATYTGTVALKNYVFDRSGRMRQIFFGIIGDTDLGPDHTIFTRVSGTNLKKVMAEVNADGKKLAKSYDQHYIPLF